MNPNISGLFEPQLSQKNNKINFGNRNGQNDISHQTTTLIISDTHKTRGIDLRLQKSRLVQIEAGSLIQAGLK